MNEVSRIRPSATAACHDVIVIGGGPGGLTAASYLGRFHRTCLVFDDDRSRASWIPESHNIPGFTAGVPGKVLLEKLRTQALQFNATIKLEHVERIERVGEGFSVACGTGAFRSRFLILATGVKDVLPPLPGIAEAIDRGIIRICPICDGYEITGRAVAVIGEGAHGAQESLFLSSFSKCVTYIHVTGKLEADQADPLRRNGIEVLETDLSNLTLEEQALEVRMANGKSRRFECAYVAFGCRVRSRLALALGARMDAKRALVVDAHQQTSVDRLYAIGDAVRGLNQVIVAAAEGAIAATAIHNRLRSEREEINIG